MLQSDAPVDFCYFSFWDLLHLFLNGKLHFEKGAEIFIWLKCYWTFKPVFFNTKRGILYESFVPKNGFVCYIFLTSLKVSGHFLFNCIFKAIVQGEKLKNWAYKPVQLLRSPAILKRSLLEYKRRGTGTKLGFRSRFLDFWKSRSRQILPF